MKQSEFFKVANHVRLGKFLEDLLDRTHSYYAVRQLASIDRNPVEWVFVSKSRYDQDAVHSPRTVARTASGQYIRKVRSDVDYSGSIAPSGRMIAFDAKQTSKKSFPLAEKYIKRHQLERLLAKERTGAIAGLIILFSEENRCFFVRASVVNDAVTNMLFKRGRKSISLADCAASGVEIKAQDHLLDWLSAIDG